MQDAVKRSILERFPIVGGGRPMADASTGKHQQPDMACVIHCQLLAKLNLATHESAFPMLRGPHRTPN